MATIYTMIREYFDQFPYVVEVNPEYEDYYFGLFGKVQYNVLDTAPCQWAIRQFKEPKSYHRFGIGDMEQEFDLIEDSVWDVAGKTFYFKNQKDAALFKLFWV